MEIFVISRDSMKKFINSVNFDVKKYNIISISDPDMEFLFPFTLPNVLQLKFNDIEADDWESESDRLYMEKRGWILFNEDHARKIINFMNNMNVENDLIINCTAGISRSGAIGDYARVKFGIPFGQFILTNKQIQPNSWIRKTLLRLDFGEHFRNDT